MSFVDQTVFEAGIGDCLRACVCSLLEMPIEEVPNFADCGFFDGLSKWLAIREIRIIQVRFADPEALKSAWFDYFYDGYCIAWGDSPRLREDGTGKRKQHAVVARAAGYRVDVCHDPHPSRDGLHSIYGLMWLVPAGGVK